MAPEIMEKHYDGQSVDLFACGVILFKMLTGEPPFQKAERADLFYKHIIQKSNLFWKAHKSDKRSGFFSKEFIALFNSMVAYDPEERLSIEEIISHPWLQGEIATPEEAFEEMQKRYDVIKSREEEKEQKKIIEK